MEPVGADNKGAEGHHHGMGDLSFPSAVASALINHMLMCLGMMDMNNRMNNQIIGAKNWIFKLYGALCSGLMESMGMPCCPSKRSAFFWDTIAMEGLWHWDTLWST